MKGVCVKGGKHTKAPQPSFGGGGDDGIGTMFTGGEGLLLGAKGGGATPWPGVGLTGMLECLCAGGGGGGALRGNIGGGDLRGGGGGSLHGNLGGGSLRGRDGGGELDALGADPGGGEAGGMG